MTPHDFIGQLAAMIATACEGLFSSWGAPQLASRISIERPASREHGDLALNIAMVAAGTAGRPPRELAEEVIDAIRADAALPALLDSVEIAGPGFINITLAADALAAAAREALFLGPGFGRAAAHDGGRILLEFVSANPTGPLHAGHARYAAYGDSLRRILAFTGHDVTTEFYINDYGTQMDLFARSLASRYGRLTGVDIPMPEEGYAGAYTEHIAGMIHSRDLDVPPLSAELTPQALAFFRQQGRDLVLEEMRSILERFRVFFDNWYSETSLYENGMTEGAIKALLQAGEAVERDGALWLQTSAYGDDKDRVLIRGTGEPTYFASDIAYHRDKLERGFDQLVNIWGADHHGYVGRMKAAFDALSHDPGRLEIVIGQLVNVMEMGERKQMSKRAGTMVTLEELIDSIGVDAARFFLVDRSHDTTLDLDLEKAKLRSEENPVYYVQYAHARICSILARAREEGVAAGAGDSYGDVTDEERSLILKLLELPRVVENAAAYRAPNRITAYGRELAAAFHVFYHNCPVLKAPAASAAFRLDLCKLTRNVIATTLDLVGVSAPESM